MNELEEIEALNELIKKGFIVAIKTKYGLQEVELIEKKNGLVITKLKRGIEIVEAPKTFMRRIVLITPRKTNASQVPPVEEIYNYLSKKKEVYYRGRKIVKMMVSGKVLILELEEGYQIYATPSDMLEYPIIIRGE